MTSSIEAPYASGTQRRPDVEVGKPGVPDALDQLDKSVELLSSHIEDLCNRLTPVLRSASSDTAAKLKSTANSAMGARLHEVRDRIEALYETVREHAHRLDI